MRQQSAIVYIRQSRWCILTCRSELAVSVTSTEALAVTVGFKPNRRSMLKPLATALVLTTFALTSWFSVVAALGADSGKSQATKATTPKLV